MGTESRSAEKLRMFLRTLPEGAREQLARALQAACDRGDDFPGAALILAELARTAPGAVAPPLVPSSGEGGSPEAALAALASLLPAAPAEAPAPAALPDAAAMLEAFIAPFAAYVVEGPVGLRPPGRLVRTHLETIWGWLAEQVMPAEVARFAQDLAAASDRAAVAAAFRAASIAPVRAQMVSRQKDQSGPIAIPRLGRSGAVETLQFLVFLIEHEQALLTALSRLPSCAGAMNDGRLTSLRATLDKMSLSPELLQAVLIGVMHRFDDPSAIARLATLAIEPGKAARLAASPYAVALTVVLDDIEDEVFLLAQALTVGRGADQRDRLKSIHDMIRGFRTALDGFQDTEWGRRLGEIRKQISSLLKAEIETAPGRVRRMIRIPTRVQDARAPDPIEVEELAAAIQLTSACRQYASELALNEVATRCFAELQHSLDLGTRLLVDSLRSVSEIERAARAAQTQAAIRFCGVVFGAEYASLLSKAAEVALRGERSKARA